MADRAAVPSRKTIAAPDRPVSPLKQWLLQGHAGQVEGPYEVEVETPPESAGRRHTHPWWRVMCLTGVDYFSTLGYQPGIAFLAAGALSPVATLVLVLLTLFGALPMYKRVAQESPHGDGSISMLEHLLPWWQGKLFVLCLIGFAATGFIITITLSAADATEHIVENPFAPTFLHGKEVAITLFLIGLLGAVFLKGFGEAVGIAVALVAVYIALNLAVIGAGISAIVQHPGHLAGWKTALLHGTGHGNPFLMIAAALLVFPKLALGLSGFETGVVVMPLVEGGPEDSPEKPVGRIRNTQKLLTTAALIMSVLLFSSSIVTSLLIPPQAFQEATDSQPAGEANGRALAFLAHKYLGEGFGTVYDVSTILILWFAGASAMAGLLNIVPRYLPRYGMAPEWTRAVRPLVILFTAIAFAVTLLFRASVDAQAGAYATGVLTLMTSATVAVMLSARRRGDTAAAIGFGVVTLVFLYTTVVNLIEQPEGLHIAAFFVGAIILTSLLSRVWRTTELRVERVELDAAAHRFVEEAAARGELLIIANKRQIGDKAEYRHKEREQRIDNRLPAGEPVLFLEIEIGDPSEFSGVLRVHGVQVDGYRVLRAQGTAVPNAIAAFLLWARDTYGALPHVYFSWSDVSPLLLVLRLLFFGEGDTAPVTHEVLRRAEPDAERRPSVHVGG